MTQVTPEPNEERRRRRLTSDELIALFVAFTTLGSVMFWSFTRTGIDLGGSMGELRSLVGDADTALLDSDVSLEGSRLGAGLIDLDDDGDDGADAAANANRLSGSLDRSASTNVGRDRSDARGDDRGANDRSRAGRNGGGLLPLPIPGQSDNNAADSNAADLSGSGAGSSSDSETSNPDAANAPDASTGAETPGAVGDGSDSGTPSLPSTDLPEIEASREALSFQDVTDDYWAKPYIDALSSRQLIQGFDETTFKPDEPVNRAQLAALINQAFVLNPEKDQIAFSDLGEAEWAQEAIEEAVKGGFMTGFPDESFQPNLPVPRVQVMTALVTGLQTQASGDVNAMVERYSDKDSIPDWAIGKVAAATQAGLAVNYPELTELAPNQPATRAEVAAMIYQALSYQGRLDPIESDYVVQP